MDDRQLLEAAAKAAGIPIHVWGAKGAESVADMSDPSNHRLWNPLTDDGDALRLALACGLEIREREASWLPGEHSLWRRIIENEERDPFAATRRAIVRAAASLQETKQ